MVWESGDNVLEPLQTNAAGRNHPAACFVLRHEQNQVPADLFFDSKRDNQNISEQNQYESTIHQLAYLDGPWS